MYYGTASLEVILAALLGVLSPTTGNSRTFFYGVYLTVSPAIRTI
jgi:hypothetical protein